MKQIDTAAARASATAQAATARRRAKELVDSHPEDGYSADWCQSAHHVGDLAVLALTLRD
jgi:hypothetical protein